MRRNDSFPRQSVSLRSRRGNRGRTRSGGGFSFGPYVRIVTSHPRIAASVVALAVCIAGYYAITGSTFFQLSRVDVRCQTPALREEIERTVRQTSGKSRLLDLNLDQMRQKIESIARVQSASITRIWPDEIRVEVVERQPAILVKRQAGNFVWLDADGVEIGDISRFRTGDDIPPVAFGFSEGDRSESARNEDRERIALYKELEREFSQGPHPLWNLIDQVNLAFTRSVELHIARPPVTVKVGSRDFRSRFELALGILDAIKRNDPETLGRFRVKDAEELIASSDHLTSIDASRPDRVVFSTPGAEKTAGETPEDKPASRKAAASPAPASRQEPSRESRKAPEKKTEKKTQKSDKKR